MNDQEQLYINPNEVCNLGQVAYPDPSLNPLRKTVSQILENNNINFRETYVYDYYTRKCFEPNNLSEFYGIKSETLSRFRPDSIFLPWMHKYPVLNYLNHDFFGKRDDQHVLNLVEKLRNLTLSILEIGYDPERFRDRKGGFITGYWLSSQSTRRFFVISGNHRTAVLGGLGFNAEVPARYELCGFCKPRDIRNNQVYKENCLKLFFRKTGSVLIKSVELASAADWPCVRNGFISEATAEQIFYKYWSSNE